MLSQKISFLGFGRMGSALAEGAVSGGVVSRGKVTVFDPEPAALSSARRLKLSVAPSEKAAVAAGDIIFLCVKPQQMAATLERVVSGGALEVRGKCFVSIAAGIPLKRIEKILGRGTAVLRVMPNTPALLKAGASAVSRGKNATARHEMLVRSVLEAVGTSVSVKEASMDAVTALSGSGPAYVFYLAEAMTEAGIALGLKPSLARQLARQTIYGAGLMLRNRPDEAEELRRQVTSPGGTTAAAVAVFDKKKLKSLVCAAVSAAAKRSSELSRI